jgi:hypothetical protein
MLHRLRPALAIAAALAVAVAVPASAPAAARQVPEGFLGVVADRAAVDGTVPLGPQMRRMANAGAETVGMALPWVDAQPYRTLEEVPERERAHYEPAGPASVPTDFRQLDRRVGAAARAGLTVHPVVIAAPPWARVDPGQEFSPPNDPAAYAAFAAALVHRYGPDGTFWSAHPRLPRIPIREWQVWNEPVGGDGDTTPSVFWVDSEPFQSRFIGLMRAAKGAIQVADPGAKVVMGALVGHSWKTLQLLYDAGGRDTFDAVALHPYTAQPGNVVRIVRYVRETMERNGDAAKPIEITELGWPAFEAETVRGLGRKKAFATQAWWLEHTFRGLIRQRERLGIDLLLWYTWIGRDRSREDAFDHSGLLNLGRGGKLTAKPALRRFYSLARAAEGRG